MRSRRYLLRKVLHALGTLAFVLAFNFVLFRAIGDPVKLFTRAGSLHLDPQEQQAMREEFGIDDPLPLQFVNYLGDTFRGEFGYSFISGRPVIESIGHRLWPTILLVGTATVLSTLLGVLIGIKGAWRRGTAFDTGSLLGSLTLYSMPEGWLGMMLLIFFAGMLQWFPAGGIESTEPLTGLSHVLDVGVHLFLPCLTLTLGYLGEFAIIMRSSLLEVMGEDFIQTARAKGVRDKEVRRRHAVPNALLPTFTLAFYSVGFILGGAVLIEEVFSWPGLGQLTYSAIEALDFPVIQAVFLLSSTAVILFNLMADVLYGYLDPRVKEG
ncbi:MAG TPA: ABC transporter permease [Actinomycetota bacterium]|nr:ABC transporter permease [Actinomycetota bacterium]